MRKTRISPRAARRRWNKAVASMHPLNVRLQRGGVRL